MKLSAIPISVSLSQLFLFLVLVVVLQFVSPDFHLRLRLPQQSISRITTFDAPKWLENDHDQRWLVAHAQGRPSPIRTFLLWIHVPKTGTSFSNTLIRWGCPNHSPNIFITPLKEIPPDLPSSLSLKSTHTWDWLFHSRDGRAFLRTNCHHRLTSKNNRYSFNMHRPLLSLREVENTVMFFRSPNQRLYSSYLHINYHYNSSKPSRLTLPNFLSRPRFLSQHSKLLLGKDYRSPKLLTLRHSHIVVHQIIPNLAFVGLTEHFQLSVRLFHAMFGGVPHRSQFDNVRPSISRIKRIVHAYDESEFNGWKDKVDEIVYEQAKKRFWKDICQHRKVIEFDGLGSISINVCMFNTYHDTKCYII